MYLSSFVENADIEEIRNQLKMHKHIINHGLRITTDDSVIKYPLHPTYNMCEDFIQLNIANIVKDMKNSDWETIKMKVWKELPDNAETEMLRQQHEHWGEVFAELEQ